MNTLERAPSIWWLHPAYAFAGLGLITALASYLIPRSTYALYWNTSKYFGLEPLLLTLLCIASFVFGSIIGSIRRVTPNWEREHSLKWQERIPWGPAVFLFKLSFYLCVAGYVFWAGAAISRGASIQLLVEAFTGEKGAIQDIKDTYLVTISGVTTLTQFGIATIVLGSLIAAAWGWPMVWRKCAIVLLLAIIRAFLNSERLAFIELLVPLLVVHLQVIYMTYPRRGCLARALLAFAPAIGAIVLLVLFTGSEYWRSYTFYADEGFGIFEFGAVRLLGYYVTGLNNGAYLLERLDLPLAAPYFTLQFLWQFPYLDHLVKILFPDIALNSPGYYMELLERGANPEFNNADGILLPLMDYGVVGGALYWLIVGVICGVLYQLLREKSPAGLCLYPVVYVGIIEAPRILYWPAGRVFPAWCLLIISALIFGRYWRAVGVKHRPSPDQHSATFV